MSRAQDFTAHCPRCGLDCTWTSTLMPQDWQRDGTRTDDQCTCGAVRM